MTTHQPQAALDYARIEKALLFIEQNVAQQPSLREIAEAVHLSEFHFERLFTRWAGTSPQRFLKFLTKEYAKGLIANQHDVYEVTDAAGLSSTSRLHDLFVTYEAMTPAEYRRRGEGLTIRYGYGETPFGGAFLAFTERGLLELGFVCEEERHSTLAKLQSEFTQARFEEDLPAAQQHLDELFPAPEAGARKPLHLLLRGTNFQIKVWEALLNIPAGRVSSYDDVAARIGQPGASRAVGSAIGANHLGYLIPCHRVIRKIGETGGYRWGSTRKRAMLGWEAARTPLSSPLPA
ncbi:MAG: methylated-DNA--[protein]-cysteine S-methyltransferase [Sphingobacteriaceae bacterium]|nr:methylated-DNA--[protein]-cysteine S-methyltransferase [Cytophagaceae bacterium]